MPAPTPAPVAEDVPTLPWPNPIITEVLFSVPTGPDGDANRDGTRQVAGDEFIELVNPHPRPIQLKGFTITDGSDPAKLQVKFTFPAFELASKGVVVIFNGHASAIPGPVGDALASPVKPNPTFHDAMVFSMKAKGSRNALSNAGDMVILKSPDGRIVHRVRWGKAPDPKVPALLDEVVPATTKASVARTGFGKLDTWKPHTEDHAELFSPGLSPGVEAKVPEAPKSGAKSPGATKP